MILQTDEVKVPEHGKMNFRSYLLPVFLSICSALVAFALGSVRADTQHETQLQEMRLDIQKIRAMPSPDQVVTKDQLTEIIRRLDERTLQIGRDVEYLREREERRSH